MVSGVLVFGEWEGYSVVVLGFCRGGGLAYGSVGHQAMRDTTSSANSKYRLSNESWNGSRVLSLSDNSGPSLLAAAGSAYSFRSSAICLVISFIALAVLKTCISRKSYTPVMTVSSQPISTTRPARQPAATTLTVGEEKRVIEGVWKLLNIVVSMEESRRWGKSDGKTRTSLLFFESSSRYLVYASLTALSILSSTNPKSTPLRSMRHSSYSSPQL